MASASTKKKVAVKTRAATKSAQKKAAKVAKQSRENSELMVTAAQRIDEKFASLGDWRGERLAEIRRLIHEVDPEVIEEWKWMGTAVWSHNGMYANANPFKDKVKITFHHGAQLQDPNKVFNAGLDGNKWRAIDLYEGDKLNKSAFKALLREAIAYNTNNKVPKSKGSRAELLGKTKKR